ncbi:P22 phage major capsid protein family protein [Microbacterium sp. NPDC089190]|uniref:P22 phage major capsid protein family protein n=1 Tax=Microbacterium sp. NPDC089190 TaxID=3155063 RepID=UPI00344BCD25
MANTLLTTQAIADQALATLYENTFLGPLVYTDYGSELSTRKQGDTINIRKPATFTAQKFDRAQGIQIQDAAEGNVAVKLDNIADVSFAVTDEDMSLKIADFDTQLLSPALEAIAQHVDTAVLELRDQVTQVAGTHAGAADEGQTWDHPEVLIEAGRLLDLNAVPLTDRYAVVGPTTKAKWLNTDLLKHADKSGSTEALRQGSIGGDLFGFEAFKTNLVGQPKAPGAQVPGDPTTEVGLAFHRSGLALASAPLAIPAGANQGQVSVASYRGLSVRVAYGWDIKYKQSVVSVDFLYGVKMLDAKRAVLLKGPNKA